MIISTRGRYALRVMIDLSQQDPDSYTPLKEIAARQEISEKYLENILKSLVTQGFILGLRGKGGGYRLTKSPEEYTLASILHATEGSLAAVACLEDHAPECARAGQCPTRPIWENWITLSRIILEVSHLLTFMNRPFHAKLRNSIISGGTK